jgi:sn-glycerol 3-phosphate transport system permease protein
VWKVLGFAILFFIAGLQNVPKSTLEAAAVDGADAWQRFRYVTLPSLAPITFFLVITILTYSFFDLFGTVDTLTRGAPAGATSVAIYEVYKTGIELKFLGRAAAQALILFAMVIVVTIWQFRVAARRGATAGR